MRTVFKSVYQFSELTDKAKEKAREWYREGALDYNWYEAVYEDADTIAKLMGITINDRPYKTMGGDTKYEKCIFFSGFSSQGDGACFEGTYEHAVGSVKAVKQHAPNDETLHDIVTSLLDIQKRHRYRVTATVKHSGHYQHSNCTEIDVECGHCEIPDGTDSDCHQVRKQLRRFMDWIYRQLNTDHDYLMSDESVDDSITANDYEFDEDGSRA